VGFFDWSAPLFAAFGDRWSDRRIREVASALRPTVPESGGAILDLGGGTGVLAARLADVLPATYTVVDPTPAMERYARKRTGIHVVLGRAEAIPFPDASFDAVVISDAFHHFPDQDGAVRELRRVVKPAGRVVMLEFDGRVWPVRLVERLVDPKGHLFAPEEFCAYLDARGITGTCRSISPTNYDFVGVTSTMTVSAPPAESGDAAAPSSAPSSSSSSSTAPGE
jgi:SAM-dependent methyltransferase